MLLQQNYETITELGYVLTLNINYHNGIAFHFDNEIRLARKIVLHDKQLLSITIMTLHYITNEFWNYIMLCSHICTLLRELCYCNRDMLK